MLAERERENTHTHTHRAREFGDKHFLFFEISCSQEKNQHSLFVFSFVCNHQSTTSKFQLPVHSNLTKLVTAGVSLVVEHTVAAHLYLAHDDAQEARNT